MDTIVARATPPGRGGVAIVRVSGPGAAAIARAVCGELPAPRHAAFLHFLDERGDPIDSGIALYFEAPASFTGEDVLELQGHGGPLVCALLLSRVVELGARPAEPGEFSLRAFLNDLKSKRTDHVGAGLSLGKRLPEEQEPRFMNQKQIEPKR